MVVFALFASMGHAQPPAGLQPLGPPPGGGGRVRSSVGSQGPLPVHQAYPQATIASGQTLFVQQCGFCHGRDASGGESGPDLTKSKLVSSDKAGENIGQVIHEGRPQKGMPSFNAASLTSKPTGN